MMKYRISIMVIRQAVKLKKMDAFAGSEVLAYLFPLKTLVQIMDDLVSEGL